MQNNRVFLDTYKKYINKGWFDSSISTVALDSWVSNFDIPSEFSESDSSAFADFLLTALIYYQENHTKAIISSIESKIRNSLNCREELRRKSRISEAELGKLWEKYQKECLFIAAAKPGDTGSSAHHISRLWRNTTKFPVAGIERLKTAIEGEKKLHIFFVDDFIGTGTKMEKLLSNDIFSDDSLYGFRRISDVISQYHSVDFNIAVIAIHQRGKERIEKEYPNIDIYYGDYYTNQYNLLSPDCIFYDTFEGKKQQILNYLINKQNELDPNNPYALNLPIAFQHGCPNNTLSLYYATDTKWNGLLVKSNPR